jgi:hypothetical protein
VGGASDFGILPVLLEWVVMVGGNDGIVPPLELGEAVPLPPLPLFAIVIGPPIGDAARAADIVVGAEFGFAVEAGGDTVAGGGVTIVVVRGGDDFLMIEGTVAVTTTVGLASAADADVGMGAEFDSSSSSSSGAGGGGGSLMPRSTRTSGNESVEPFGACDRAGVEVDALEVVVAVAVVVGVVVVLEVGSLSSSYCGGGGSGDGSRSGIVRSIEMT